MAPARRTSPAKTLSAAGLRQLAEQLGVSRVARVTGLDRGGVEVACAVRPGGHVLQVSNGKGLDAERAKAGALLEAAELWAAERPRAESLIFASLDELQRRGGEVWPLEDELLEPGLFSSAVRIAWLRAARLDRNASVLVPASVVHCVPSSGPSLGPALHRWTSNGMGAHPDGGLALRHALLEAAERDGLSRALPRGWTEKEIRRRKIAPETLARAAPQAARMQIQLGESGFTAHLFDLSPERGGESWLGLALAGALLIDDEAGPIPIAAGYCCAPDRDAALTCALLEAAQSRLTDVHGAREDVAPQDREAMRALAMSAARAKGKLDASALPQVDAASIAQLIARFSAAGFSRLAALDLAPPGCAARVIKVIVPGLLLSELLR